MIVESDNGATYTLIDNIESNVLNEVYSDLGITHPEEDSANYQIATRTYALFFRVLFNATYLRREYSEQALELLVRATYRDGLNALLPKDLTVAHKFGEHVVSSDRKTPEGIELHDCGIVYYPEHPYLLCVMTRAKEQSDAESMIQQISKEVYETVKSDTEI
jgi:beta-lactamase class A